MLPRDAQVVRSLRHLSPSKRESCRASTCGGASHCQSDPSLVCTLWSTVQLNKTTYSHSAACRLSQIQTEKKERKKTGLDSVSFFIVFDYIGVQKACKKIAYLYVLVHIYILTNAFHIGMCHAPVTRRRPVITFRDTHSLTHTLLRSLPILDINTTSNPDHLTPVVQFPACPSI